MDSSLNFEAEVEQAWKNDADLTAVREAANARLAELKALKRAIEVRENAIIADVKKRRGMPSELTDFECMLEESRAGIH